jgi:hypothetical protein
MIAVHLLNPLMKSAGQDPVRGMARTITDGDTPPHVRLPRLHQGDEPDGET